MFTQHVVLLYILAFDLIIGALLLRYVWLSRGTSRLLRYRGFIVTVAGAVNMSGVFCGAEVVKTLTVFGGLPLVLLLLSAIDKQAKSKGV